MGGRSALLVGSLPYVDEREAMSVAIAKLGSGLRSLPDGEIGRRDDAHPRGTRSSWIVMVMDRCEADTANWEVIRPAQRNADGVPDGYGSFCVLRPRHPPDEIGAHLNFGWRDYALASYPTFRELRARAGLRDLRFQVGLPTGLGSTGMLLPEDRMAYAPAFNARLALEANEIARAVDDDDLVIQLELPPELSTAYWFPRQQWGGVIDLFLELVHQISAAPLFGIHLCFSDLNHQAAVNAATLDPLVSFTNLLLERWPATHRLDYVHVPLAEGAEPPPLDVGWYAPLADLDLPTDTRFVGGFVHEGRPTAELFKIRDALDRIRNGPVDVAASCGLGRRRRETVDAMLETTARLLND